MTTYQIAHIVEQGQQIILIPVDDQFEYKLPEDKQSILGSLQFCATSARLAGTVVLVWNNPSGRLAFMGPHQWHPWLRTLTMQRVIGSLNNTLICQF
jgi:hypothetical protein